MTTGELPSKITEETPISSAKTKALVVASASTSSTVCGRGSLNLKSFFFFFFLAEINLKSF